MFPCGLCGRRVLFPSFLRSLRISANIVAEHDGLRNLPHGLALLAAPPLDGEVRLFFIEPQIALQNSFGALHNLPRLEVLGQS